MPKLWDRSQPLNITGKDKKSPAFFCFFRWRNLNCSHHYSKRKGITLTWCCLHQCQNHPGRHAETSEPPPFFTSCSCTVTSYVRSRERKQIWMLQFLSSCLFRRGPVSAEQKLIWSSSVSIYKKATHLANSAPASVWECPCLGNGHGSCSVHTSWVAQSKICLIKDCGLLTFLH